MPPRMRNLDAFKAYDVRGRIPDEINEELAYDIGRAYAAFVKPRRIAVGYDIRLSSPPLAQALKRGLTDCGIDVADIGLWGTEGSYFATFAEQLDGGIMVTASHNPPDYNGMKFVREEARPISADTGLLEMRALIESARLPRGAQAQETAGGGERRQRRRRPHRGCTRAAPAVRVCTHQQRPRRPLSARRTQPHAGGKSRRDRGSGASQRRRPGTCVGR